MHLLDVPLDQLRLPGADRLQLGLCGRQVLGLDQEHEPLPGLGFGRQATHQALPDEAREAGDEVDASSDPHLAAQ